MGLEFLEHFRGMPADGAGRVLRPAVTRQAHQPGRGAVEAQNTLGGLLRREHGYDLPSGADDVDHPAGGQPGYELGQRAAELGGRATSRESRRGRSQDCGQDGLPQCREVDACYALQGEQVTRQDDRNDDRYMGICRAYDAVLVHAQRHGGNQGADPDQLKDEEELGPAEGREHVCEQQACHEDRAVDRENYEHVSRCCPFRAVQRQDDRPGERYCHATHRQYYQ